MFYLFIISLFCLGSLFALSGVVLGGWLVYRTKRDPYDPLFSGQKPGEVFTLDDGLTTGDDTPSSAKMPGPTETANSAFMDQFVAGLTEKK